MSSNIKSSLPREMPIKARGANRDPNGDKTSRKGKSNVITQKSEPSPGQNTSGL